MCVLAKHLHSPQHLEFSTIGITLFNLAPQKLHSKIKRVSEDRFRAEVVEEKGEKEKI